MSQHLYRDSQMSAIDNFLSRFQEISDWYHPDDKELGFYRATILCRDNRSALAEVLGARHEVSTGEFRHDVWRVEHGGLAFWVATAKGKGTSIAVETAGRGQPWQDGVWSDHDIEEIVGFLDTLFRKLHAAQSDWMPPGWVPPEDAVAMSSAPTP